MRYLASIFAALTLRRVNPQTFANEAAEEIPIFANQLAPDEKGWVQLAPYGDFRNIDDKGKPVIQRFAKDDAMSIVNEFNSLLNTPQRLLGLPWYVGHPDHPRFKALHTDSRAYGRIKKVEARDDGLYANVKWSGAGRQLLDDEAYHGHSVNWSAVPKGIESGVRIFRPISLKSVGFTNQPQIPVPPASLANENPDPQPTPFKMPPWILTLAGFAADATPSETELKSALQAKLSAVVPNQKPIELMVGEDKFTLTIVNEAPAELATKLTAFNAALVTARAEKETLATAFANERKARATAIVSAAITAGRLIPAKKDETITTLCNAGDGFEAAATLLANSTPVVKTKPLTGRIGLHTPEVAATVRERQAKLNVLLSAREQQFPNEDYDTRYGAVINSSEGQQIFAQMQGTATK